MEKRVLILTGNPGTGKTTALLKIVGSIKTQGFSVGGMVSQVREGNARVGFEIIDLTTNRRGWLAHVNQKRGPQVGRYSVNLEDLESIGVQAISMAVEACNVIAIDEIGPMELFSEKFKEATQKALSSNKLVIAVVHWKASDKLVKETKSREDSEVFIVTVENREKLPEVIIAKTIKFLKVQM